MQLSHERLAEMMGEAIRELAWSGASNLCIGKSNKDNLSVGRELIETIFCDHNYNGMLMFN